MKKLERFVVITIYPRYSNAAVINNFTYLEEIVDYFKHDLKETRESVITDINNKFRHVLVLDVSYNEYTDNLRGRQIPFEKWWPNE